MLKLSTGSLIQKLNKNMLLNKTYVVYINMNMHKYKSSVNSHGERGVNNFL